MKIDVFNNRLSGIDFIRSIAILLVILNHSVENVLNMENPEVIKGFISYSSFLPSLLFTLGRIGVPLFLMITGFTMLHRDYFKENKIKHFYKNNFLSLFITTAIWIFLYNIFLTVFFNRPFNLLNMFLEIFLLKQLYISHFWYLPMIIGFYFFLPFIANGLKGVKLPYLWLIAAFCIFTLSSYQH